ncbi:MAG: energy-coupling factor ABC transporter ATP-binding protein [Natronincolaceae bacterium]|jgi:energy-coupling factor transport system ATP-binding protein|nr:ABC transporter ATP-binding protein [Bacillota bacterium]NLK91052.1 ABC transporter ATP-binding protein [Clostridiales bacterium]
MIYPIEVNDLYYKYEGNLREILNGVNLKVVEGEAVAIVGLSGCGKSTLLYNICGIIPHIYKGEARGQVKIWGKNILDMKLPEIATKVGIVFQDPDTQLFSPTVENEIAFGPENLCVAREEIGLRIERVLKIVNMEKYRLENPNSLSGGQKQLIAIASVLAMETEILLFDEILSQIDHEGKIKIREVIKELKGEGKTIVLIEHDLDNLQIADRVLQLKDGKLEEFKDGETVGLNRA